MNTIRSFHRLLPVFPLLAALAVDAVAAQPPARPNVILDTTPVTPTGRTITVAAGENLQTALNSAAPGDVVELAAGATFTGSFVLPKKTGSGWVWIRTSAYGSLPARGTRVSPNNANLMAKIVSPNYAPAITFDTAASFYRLSGIEITTTVASTLLEQYGLVAMGTAATSLSQLPTDVVFDRCYIHGTPTGNVRRGIAMNSARTAVVDSYLSDFHETNTDTQAIASWNGSGPFKIVNNYLEGASENVLFGGADPGIPNLVPSDIEIRNNYFNKPLKWKVDDPSYAGIHWNVKNLLEFKNAQRVLVDGNVLEHNWQDGQTGFAILVTPRNQGGTAPWSVTQDITFTNNIVRHVGSAVNISGTDSDNPSQRTARVLVRNNLFDDVNGPAWGNADGRLFQVLSGANDVAFRHNTGIQSSVIMMADGSPANQGFEFADNITAPGTYGFFGSNYAEGNGAIAHYFPGATFTANVLTGRDPSLYSNYPGNFSPASMAAVGFVDATNGNYRLSSASPFTGKATDGKDIGVDFAALDAAQAGANAPPPSGSPATPPTPSPTASPSTPTPDPIAPTTSIVSPLSGATVSGTQAISVAASDNVGVANGAIMIDGAIVASFSGTSATYNWNTVNASVGNHTLQSKAQDAAGNVGMSAQVGVTVSRSTSDTTPPSVTITYPTSGATVAAGAQTITENVSDNVGVTLVKTLINSSVVCQKTAPPYSCPVTLSGTGATVDVIAYDAAGNSRLAEVNVKVAASGTTSSSSTPGTPDTTPPSVTITYPTSGATVAAGAQTITENVSDNVGVTLVKTLINSSVVCQKTAPPYSCPVTLSGTGATVDVIAYDAAGNSRLAEVNVKVAASGTTSSSSTPGTPDTTPPSVTITYPTSGATVAAGAQTITENVSDNVGVTLVKTLINSSVVCQKTAPPYSCPVTLSGTGATVDVIAYDAAGNSRLAEVNVKVKP